MEKFELIEKKIAAGEIQEAKKECDILELIVFFYFNNLFILKKKFVFIFVFWIFYFRLMIQIIFHLFHQNFIPFI